MPAMCVPFFGSLSYFVLFRESGPVQALYAATKVFTLVWPVLAVWFILNEALPRPRLSRADFRAAGFGLATGGAIVVALAGLLQTSLSNVLTAGVPAIRAKVQSFGMLDHYWLFALLLSTVHALLEEYYWRWFVYGQLRRRVRPITAHTLAGIAFALHHVVIAGVYFGWGWGLLLGGCVGIGGIVWSVSYERQRTLSGAWCSHMVADLGLMAVGHRLLYGSWI